MRYFPIAIILLALVFCVGCWKQRNPDSETINIENIEVPDVKNDEDTAEKPDEIPGEVTENEPEVEPGFIHITAIDGLDVHIGPGNPFPIVGHADNGKAYRKLDKLDTGNWYKIQLTEDETGWIEGNDDTIKIGDPLDDGTVDGDALKRKWAERG